MRLLFPTGSGTAIYDSRRHRVVRFGGAYVDCTFPLCTDHYRADTYALDLTDPPQWEPLTSCPYAMAGHSAIYDAHEDRMVAFGGSFRTGLNTHPGAPP